MKARIIVLVFSLVSALAFSQPVPESVAKDGLPPPKPENALTSLLDDAGSYLKKETPPTRHLEAYSGFAFGFGITQLGFGVATDFPIPITDMLAKNGSSRFKDKNGRLILDFKEIASDPAIKSNGLDINVLFYTQRLFQFEFSGINKKRGFGLSVGGIDSRFDINLNKEIFNMLADGITSGVHPFGVNISGAVFAEGLRLNFHTPVPSIPRLFFSFTAAHYIPLVYIPRSTVAVKFTNTNNLELGMDGTASAYMAVNVFKFIDGGFPDSFDWGGVDLSIQAEYALFPVIDAGITISNIPVAPAALHTKTKIKFTPERNTLLHIDDLIKDSFTFNTDKLFDFEHTEESCDAFWVVRPMKADFYTLFRPFRTDFFVLRPNIGLTFFNPSEETYFNYGIEAALNFGRALTAAWWTGSADGVFRNRFGFDLRIWKIARLSLALEMRSQDYLGVWNLKGAGFEIGFKFGGGFNGITNF
ncbi:MAG: hypothetical protein LBG79_03140 [Spirochaetaceae bacterium]|jgi:hypothetical protein|nr:hypothetical protein [Spirochaetaceae bacterium]GMO19576.1 MAG: hypothetical protein Pg6A_06290 [Termitinemataceae bacterium]